MFITKATKAADATGVARAGDVPAVKAVTTKVAVRAVIKVARAVATTKVAAKAADADAVRVAATKTAAVRATVADRVAADFSARSEQNKKGAELPHLDTYR